MAQRYPIVVGVDFGASGDVAFGRGAALARTIPGAELHLAHVVRAHAPEVAGGQSLAERLVSEARAFAEASRRLSELAAEADARGRRFVHDVVLHVRAGEPAASLADLAHELDAGLVVVGSRAQCGAARGVLGTVSERLLSLSEVPVLLAPLPSRALPRPHPPRPSLPGQQARSGEARAPRVESVATARLPGSHALSPSIAG